jgi:hypothetical protein
MTRVRAAPAWQANDEARTNDEDRIALCDLDLLISNGYLSFDINSTFVILVSSFNVEGLTDTFLCGEAEKDS